MDANNILQVITLGVVGWTLKEVICLKVSVAALKQRVKDLPCSICDPNPQPKEENEH